MIHIKLLKDSKVIQETLSRLGIVNESTKILYPSCYLITIDGEKYISHFKELFRFINKDYYSDMSDVDFERLNAVTWCIEKWCLIESLEEIGKHSIKIDCIRFEDKKSYIIKHKIKIKNIEEILG